MPRTRKEMASDARAVARVLEDAAGPLRLEEVRRELRAIGIALTVKQARRTLDRAEQLHLVGRVNRSRWGRFRVGHLPPAARRSRAETVIDAAAHLLELPASTELNRAVRAVLRLATEQAAHPVPSRHAPRVPTPAAAPDTPTPLATRERKANGANDAADKIEVRLDPHS